MFLDVSEDTSLMQREHVRETVPLPAPNAAVAGAEPLFSPQVTPGGGRGQVLVQMTWTLDPLWL